jgi:Domain of unknown function (DUF5666)
MASSRLSSAVFLAAAVGLAIGLSDVQAQTRLRGTITAVDGKGLTVDGKEQVTLGEKTEIVFTQPIALADVKPGDFLGVTSVKHPDGKLVAYEVRRFPKPVSPGHRPFDGRDDQTMTNASVGTVTQSASGRELTLNYEGGAQKIVVPENASVSALVPGNRSQLVRGAPVSLTMDTSRVAIRIQVSPPKQ